MIIKFEFRVKMNRGFATLFRPVRDATIVASAMNRSHYYRVARDARTEKGRLPVKIVNTKLET
jgi:hypothetical protein